MDKVETCEEASGLELRDRTNSSLCLLPPGGRSQLFFEALELQQ